MGSISDALKDRVNSKNEAANQYKADIDKFKQGIEDLKKARKLFEESGSTMDGLILETDGVFQGDAATQFCIKLSQYNTIIKTMPSLMDLRIKSFEKRIRSLERQKGWSEFWGGVYSGLMDTFKFFGL